MFLFLVFSAIALVAALGVVLSRKPVYSALFLLLNFAMLAALFITLQAQFLAAAQIIVYAGAIVVLFLFVVMLIGGGELGAGDREIVGQSSQGASNVTRSRLVLTGPRVIALVLSGLLFASLGYSLIAARLYQASNDAVVFGNGSAEAIGAALYTSYLLPFEMTSVLLLVGMIGAVVLARND
jgi:NADH-quinone oxidoreductase subunit J